MPVTLADVERELGRRAGPFFRFGVAASPAPTSTLVPVASLKSSSNAGGYEGLYALRRAKKTDGTPIANPNADDRVRLVKYYDANAGTLEVDRPYNVTPVATEEVEVGLLDPVNEARVAAQRGLDRCWVRDRVQVALFAYAAERDLTVRIPWLTRVAQLYGASEAPVGTIWPPFPVEWFKPFEMGGHVWLGAAPDPYPFTFWVYALRPASSRINGLSAPPCPAAVDVATGGALLADTVYRAAVAVRSAIGTSPACPPVLLYTATDASNTHVVRLQIAQDPNGRSYPVYLSPDAAPKLVATITEAQRAAGCTVTAVNTVSATSPGAGLVDVQVVGTGAAAVQAAPPSNDDDLLDVPIEYAAAAAHNYAWEAFPERLSPVTGRASKDDVRKAWGNQIAANVPDHPDRLQLAAPYPRASLYGGGDGYGLMGTLS